MDEWIDPDSPVQTLPGIGPARAVDLADRGIESVGDLLRFAPLEYILPSDRSDIADAVPEKIVALAVTLQSIRLLRRGWGRATVEGVIVDDSGSARCLWFRVPYLARTLKPGSRLFIKGSLSGSPPAFLHPQFEVIRDGEESLFDTILPRYPNVLRLPPRTLRKAIRYALDRLPDLSDPLSLDLRERIGLSGLKESILALHRPETAEDAAQARRRFVFEELYRMQSVFANARGARRRFASPSVSTEGRLLLKRLVDRLPFCLTDDQEKVLCEFIDDLESGVPMERLLVGDVGSGKTVAAAAAIAHAIGSGGQAALLVPTEVLAGQHAENLSRLFGPLGIRTEFLTGDTPVAEKRRIRKETAEGDTDLVIGTHALLQENVRFRRLALAVVDEQHRFGVRQRAILPAKGDRTSLLLLSATPIPRSLALTLYGDLDLSVIRTMPPGRKPVVTRHLAGKERKGVYDLLRERLAKGEQAFVLYPLVEESEKSDRKAAVTAAKSLAAGPFCDFRVGLLHGRLPAADRIEELDRFRKRETDLLVSTTVVEVGVDLPHATVMIVEHADRFGLSQLHQIRGRVGRSDLDSWCFLMTDGPLSVRASERMRVLERETDGFRIAEEDLRQRGPGDLLGERQHGPAGFGAADLIRDLSLLEAARREAFADVPADTPGPHPPRAG